MKCVFLRGESELFFKRNDVPSGMAKCLQTNAPNSVLMEGTLFRLHCFFAPFPAFGLILC